MPNPIKRVEYVCLTLNESVYAKPNYLGSRMRKRMKVLVWMELKRKNYDLTSVITNLLKFDC